MLAPMQLQLNMITDRGHIVNHKDRVPLRPEIAVTDCEYRGTFACATEMKIS
jgi:hypothetical protein